MVLERTISDQASETGKGGRLATILANMLRSALAWEKEHGSRQCMAPKRSGNTSVPEVVQGGYDHGDGDYHEEC